ERGFLELHHVEPHAVGGEATADNIQLRCRAHNAYEAELFYGRGKVVRRDDSVSEPSAVYSCITEPRTRSGTSNPPRPPARPAGTKRVVFPIGTSLEGYSLSSSDVGDARPG